METPFQTAVRLLGALEDLVAQETLLLHTMDFVEAVGVQERAAPLVGKLCALAPDPEVASLRPRLAALLDRRRQNFHFLDVQLTRLEGELRRVNEARGRLHRVGPAYGAGRPSESVLNTAA